MSNTWNDLHQKSQAAIADDNLELALEYEILAIKALDPIAQQRTLGITVLSACAIAHRANNIEKFKQIAEEWINKIPVSFADAINGFPMPDETEFGP